MLLKEQLLPINTGGGPKAQPEKEKREKENLF
jgi:hypothetical protein